MIHLNIALSGIVNEKFGYVANFSIGLACFTLLLLIILFSFHDLEIEEATE